MKESATQTATAPSHVALRANRTVEILDYLRVPYEVAPEVGDSADLTWIEAGAGHVCWPHSLSGRDAGAWRLGDIRVFGRLLDGDAADRALGFDWTRAEAVHDPDGAERAHLRRGPGGSTFVPF